MDFKESIRQLSNRAKNKDFKEKLLTEEATKNALIMPFIQSLGYDVFNPLEVVPEMDCDITKKKGEKIDYAIMKDGEAVLVIECKHWQQQLDNHKTQLTRYFTSTNAKFGLLTNGIEYRFYTDNDKPNLMDETPFLVFNIETFKDNELKNLENFTKENFNIDSIKSSASEMKYMAELKKGIKNLFEDPDSDIVKIFAKPVYNGKFTESVLSQFVDLFKRAAASYINDIISERLNKVVEKSEEEQQHKAEDAQAENNDSEKDNEIITTQTEIEAYYIVKSILRSVIDGSRVFMRDAKSYCSILIDDNNRKPICRLHFNNENNLRFEPITADGKGERYKIESLDGIFEYSDQLVEIAQKYV